MAKTFIGYQPRDPQVQLNWAEIGNNVTNVVQEELDVRQKKKAAIDKATREFQIQLNDNVQGESTTLNEWSLKFSERAKEQVLIQDRLLKQGILKPSDYAVMRQNLTDGTDEAFSLVQEYQDEYSIKMERMKSQDIDASSAELEQFLMADIEGFGNFENTELIVNPENGKLSVAFKKLNPETGEMEFSYNPNDLRSVSALRNQVKSRYDKFNIEKSASNFVDNLGAVETLTRVVGSRTKAGQIIKTVNPMDKALSKEAYDALGMSEEEREGVNLYLEAEDDYITGQISNPYQMASVLTDYVNSTDGGDYTFTFDKEEAKGNKNLILLENKGGGVVPVFDNDINPNAKEQEDAVRAYMRNNIRNRIDVTSENKTVSDWNSPTYAPEYVRKGRAKAQQEKEAVNIFGNFYNGDRQQIREAEQYFRSLNPNISKIDRDGDKLTIIYQDGSQQSLEFDGQTASEFITGGVNFMYRGMDDNNLIKDASRIVRQSNYGSGTKFNPNANYIGTPASTPQMEKDLETYSRVVRGSNDETWRFGTDQDGSSLGNYITNLPGNDDLIVKEKGNILEVRDQDGNVLKQFTKSDDKAQNNKRIDELIEFSFNRADKDIRESIIEDNKQRVQTKKLNG